MAYDVAHHNIPFMKKYQFSLECFGSERISNDTSLLTSASYRFGHIS